MFLRTRCSKGRWGKRGIIATRVRSKVVEAIILTSLLSGGRADKQEMRKGDNIRKCCNGVISRKRRIPDVESGKRVERVYIV